MTITTSKVHLLNVESGQQEEAELFDAITEQQLADWEDEWMPELFKAIQRLRRSEVELRYGPQIRRLNWRRKAEELMGMLAWSGFGLICGGLTQGMMFVDTTTKRCRVESQRGRNLVYVEFVEDAPWNRKELVDSPRYRGVGTTMIRAAIDLSTDLEFHGRIGLHSLPQANGFYANTCGMTDLGADPDYESSLRYFEMTSEQAQAFITKGETTT